MKAMLRCYFYLDEAHWISLKVIILELCIIRRGLRGYFSGQRTEVKKRLQYFNRQKINYHTFFNLLLIKVSTGGLETRFYAYPIKNN